MRFASDLNPLRAGLLEPGHRTTGNSGFKNILYISNLLARNKWATRASVDNFRYRNMPQPPFRL